MRTTQLRIVEQPAPVAVSDEILLDRWSKGIGAAGEELVRRFCEPLTRYLRRLVGNDQMAEELQQQTWLSVLEHVGKFNRSSGPGGFRAWLFRIATNKAHDFWRSRGRERNAKEGMRLVIEDEAPGASEPAERAEEAEKLKRAIAQLPDSQREVLMLRYYGQLKFVEIADLLGCPLNTALGRMHKAMLKLKEIMEA